MDKNFYRDAVKTNIDLFMIQQPFLNILLYIWCNLLKKVLDKLGLSIAAGCAPPISKMLPLTSTIAK